MHALVNQQLLRVASKKGGRSSLPCGLLANNRVSFGSKAVTSGPSAYGH